MFEHHSQPLLSQAEWLLRLAKSLRLAAVIIIASLLMGILGYHYFGHLDWVDAVLEAAMILSGMGSVAVMNNDTVKIFASFYALVSGFVVLGSFSVVLAPVLHRFLHHFHRTNGHRTEDKS